MTKILISKKVSKVSDLSLRTAKDFTNKFFEIFIKKLKEKKSIKIHRFGHFISYETPQRVGRNPKTKESYIITSRLKAKFKSSNIVKQEIN